MKHLAVEAINEPVGRIGELRGALDERLEHRLKLERRAADHLQDFAGSRLLLQRLAQLRVGLG